MKIAITLGSSSNGTIVVVKYQRIIDEAIPDFVSMVGVDMETISAYNDIIVLILPGTSSQKEAYRQFNPKVNITLERTIS